MTAAEMIQTAAARRARLMRPANARFDPETQRSARHSDLPQAFTNVDHATIDRKRGAYTAAFYTTAIAKQKARAKQEAHEALKRMEAERRAREKQERDEIVTIANRQRQEREAQNRIEDEQRQEAERKAIMLNQAKPRIRTIERATCLYFKVDRYTFNTRSQRKEISYMRHVAMYVCNQYTGRSFPEIGRYFGKDHTTVLHGVHKIKGMIGDCQRTHDAVRAILELIGLQGDLA